MDFFARSVIYVLESRTTARKVREILEAPRLKQANHSHPSTRNNGRGAPLTNNRRLLEPIGNIPPAEAENAYHAAFEDTPIAA